MSLRRAALAAQQLLDTHGVRTAPVDVEGLVAELGVQVVRKPMEDAISGLLLIRGDQAVIGVNKSHHPHRQRFSIAHELGHYLLHRDAGDLFVDSSLTFYRDQRSSDGVFEQEIEANAFAAALLMPEDLLRSYIAEEQLDLHDEQAAARLASNFGVSGQALAIRLARLNLIPA